MTAEAKPTILFTLERYDKGGGGVYEVIHQVATRFQRSGYPVKVATSNSGGTRPVGKEMVEGIEVNCSDLRGNLASGLHGDILSYKNFLLAQEYDVVISYAAQQAFMDVLFLFAEDIKKKKIIIPCGYSGMYWPNFANYFSNLPKFLKSFDAQIFHSFDYRDYEFSRRHGFENLHLVPNGFDKQEIESAAPGFRKKYGIKPDARMFLHVGNVTGLKGHIKTLLVYLLGMVPNSVMIFIGQPLHPRSRLFVGLCNLVTKYSFGWKKAVLLECDRVETIQAFKEADLFLFFSNIEYSPLVLFEAAGAGLPFLASDCGNACEIAEWSGMGQIVNTEKSETGFSKMSVKDAVKRLRQWAKSPEKPVAKDGFYDEFNWDSLFLKYERVVQEILQK